MKPKSIKERMIELDNNPEANAEDWELLAGECLTAEDYNNAATCFTRADAIKDREMKYKNTYSVSTKRILAAVGAPWDQPAGA